MRAGHVGENRLVQVSNDRLFDMAVGGKCLNTMLSKRIIFGTLQHGAWTDDTYVPSLITSSAAA